MMKLFNSKIILLTSSLYLQAAAPLYGQRRQELPIRMQLIHYATALSKDEASGLPGTGARYLEEQFRALGLQPAGDHGSYLQSFSREEGLRILGGTFLSIGGQSLRPGRDFFPLARSANGSFMGQPTVGLQEPGKPWILNLKDLLTDPLRDSSLSPDSLVYASALQAQQNGASAVLFEDPDSLASGIGFDPRDQGEAMAIPLLVIRPGASRRYFRDAASVLSIRGGVRLGIRILRGSNLLGLLDRKAPSTLIFAAILPDSGRGIRSAAIPLMLEWASLLRKETGLNYNMEFLVIGVSGDLDWGAREFIRKDPTGLNKARMVMDMDLPAGRNRLRIGGLGPGPEWIRFLDRIRIKGLEIIPDPEARIPGALRPFNRAHIPVLFFGPSHSVREARRLAPDTPEARWLLWNLRFLHRLDAAPAFPGIS